MSRCTYIVYVPWLILIPILGFFLLKDAEAFRRSALLMLPRGRWRWRGDEFFQDINSTLAAYIRAQLTACLFIGVVCAIGFTVLGLPGGLVMGFMAGVFEFVPLVGPLVDRDYGSDTCDVSRRSIQCFSRAAVSWSFANCSGLCDLSETHRSGYSSASARSDLRDLAGEKLGGSGGNFSRNSGRGDPDGQLSSLDGASWQ